MLSFRFYDLKSKSTYLAVLLCPASGLLGHAACHSCTHTTRSCCISQLQPYTWMYLPCLLQQSTVTHRTWSPQPCSVTYSAAKLSQMYVLCASPCSGCLCFPHEAQSAVSASPRVNFRSKMNRETVNRVEPGRTLNLKILS